MEVDLWIWLAFAGFVVTLLALDLFVFHREAHEVSFREATVFSAAWIGLGLAFGVLILVWQGAEKRGEYFAGYLIEKALSVDNVFVFALLSPTSRCRPSTSTGSCSGGSWARS
jgi:tellurite resistance protein TerC